MGAGLLAVKSGFILFIKSHQFPLPGYIALSVDIRQQVFAFADSARSYSVD
jgi:hypothetical protein